MYKKMNPDVEGRLQLRYAKVASSPEATEKPTFYGELSEFNDDTKKHEWVTVTKGYKEKKEAEKALSRILDKEDFDVKGRVITASFSEDGMCPNCGDEAVEWDESLNDHICTHCGWVGSDEIVAPDGWDAEPEPLPPSDFCECESNFCPHGEVRCQNPPQEKVRIFGYGTTLCEPCRKMHEQEAPGEVEILSKFAAINNPKSASFGDEYEETIEMSDSFGDLADLAANLPHQDKHEE